VKHVSPLEGEGPSKEVLLVDFSGKSFNRFSNKFLRRFKLRLGKLINNIRYSISTKNQKIPNGINKSKVLGFTSVRASSWLP
tara:strand:- start:496 stop:741 length:246 start_codon:yes stop_codon:yes gene_type:complete